MSRTYKATGINLKSIPLGEADRLVTILTREYGLIRVVAPGARNQKSKLAGRSGLFVVNQLLLAKGKSLDKITQAETLVSYPGFCKDLSKLAASQYLAELVLCHALSGQPQEELYELLNEHLRRLEQLPNQKDQHSGSGFVIAHLSQGIFHLLALAGIAPQLRLCCLTQRSINPDFADPNWRIGFSIEAGGTVSLAPKRPEVTKPEVTKSESQRLKSRYPVFASEERYTQATESNNYDERTVTLPRLNHKLNAIELAIFQQLGSSELPQLSAILSEYSGSFSDIKSIEQVWVRVELILREYTQYHLGRSIRSAKLLDDLSMPN
ncbi:DNA repair protein RecO [Lyngbya aestuarii]|uniref:DNA repair protein RecO n=1 Tax=Lyngbya aestuarii TaxID=118322 RepID=UPI00403D9EDE